MKKNKQANGDWLTTLTIMGRILVFVPIIVGLIVFISSFFWQNEIAEESIIEGSTIAIIHNNVALQTLTGGAFMIFLCGLATLVYVAIKRFRQGLHGDLEDEEK